MSVSVPAKSVRFSKGRADVSTETGVNAKESVDDFLFLSGRIGENERRPNAPYQQVEAGDRVMNVFLQRMTRMQADAQSRTGPGMTNTWSGRGPLLNEYGGFGGNWARKQPGTRQAQSRSVNVKSGPPIRHRTGARGRRRGSAAVSRHICPLIGPNRKSVRRQDPCALEAGRGLTLVWNHEKWVLLLTSLSAPYCLPTPSKNQLRIPRGVGTNHPDPTCSTCSQTSVKEGRCHLPSLATCILCPEFRGISLGASRVSTDCRILSSIR